MQAPIDFFSDPAPRDIGDHNYDQVRRVIDDAGVDDPWDDEPTKPGGD